MIAIKANVSRRPAWVCAMMLSKGRMISKNPSDVSQFPVGLGAIGMSVVTGDTASRHPIGYCIAQ